MIYLNIETLLSKPLYAGEPPAAEVARGAHHRLLSSPLSPSSSTPRRRCMSPTSCDGGRLGWENRLPKMRGRHRSRPVWMLFKHIYKFWRFIESCQCDSPWNEPHKISLKVNQFIPETNVINVWQKCWFVNKTTTARQWIPGFLRRKHFLTRGKVFIEWCCLRGRSQQGRLVYKEGGRTLDTISKIGMVLMF